MKTNRASSTTCIIIEDEGELIIPKIAVARLSKTKQVNVYGEDIWVYRITLTNGINMDLNENTYNEAKRQLI